MRCRMGILSASALWRMLRAMRVWTPPGMQAISFILAMSNAVEFRRVSGLIMRPSTPRALMDRSGIGSKSVDRVQRHLHQNWLFRSRPSRLFAHKPPLRTTAFQPLQPSAVRRQLELGTPRRWPSRPKRHGRSYSPAQPRPAFWVCGRASAQATNWW
jgi:hypothetical protein